jgi:hypothetical protein
MAHGDTWEGKWRGNSNGVGSPILFTLPRNMVYPALLPLMRTHRLPVVDWTDVPRRFKCTRPFRRKTKSGFCACAITFQTQSNTYRHKMNHWRTSYRSKTAMWSLGDERKGQAIFIWEHYTPEDARCLNFYLACNRGVQNPGRHVNRVTNSVKIPSCHLSGALNFATTPKFCNIW